MSAWLPSETLAALGVDSLDEVRIRNEFQAHFKAVVPLSFFATPNLTLEALADRLREAAIGGSPSGF